MSGILKGVGKVFKKVFKVVKKVAPIALAVGAIVLTGGAAIGALPAVGSVLGGLGLSAGVTTALTSAVTMAGWGGLAGLVMGGPKGMVKGALMGGLTGGLLGGVGMLGAAAPAAGAGGSLIESGVAGGGYLASAAPAAAAGGAAAPAAAAASGGGGFSLSGLLGNGGLGTILSGVGGGLSKAGDAKAEEKLLKQKQKQIAENYNINGGPLAESLLSPWAHPGYNASPELDPYQSTTQWEYDPEQGRMVRRQVAAAA